jgi:hypothetical protein
MRKVINTVIIFFILFLLINGNSGFSQTWGGVGNVRFGDLWSVNINGGVTSYFGDISIYDTDISLKLSKESGPAFGFLVSKSVSNTFSFSGQFLIGSFKARNQNLSFETQFIEYNAKVNIDFVNMFAPKKPHNYGITGYIGVGNYLFNSTRKDYFEAKVKTTTTKARVPEFVFILGSGVFYKFVDDFSVTFDLGLRQSQNDKLDSYNHGTDFDYYSYMSIGLTYNIPTKVRKPLKEKTKIVYNGNTRLKPLRYK